MFKPGDKIICIDVAPVHGIRDGGLALTLDKVYEVVEYIFNLDGVATGLNARYVATTGDAGGLIVCRSNRFIKIC